MLRFMIVMVEIASLPFTPDNPRLVAADCVILDAILAKLDRGSQHSAVKGERQARKRRT